MDRDKLQKLLEADRAALEADWEEAGDSDDYRDTYNCGWLEGRIRLLEELLSDV